MSQPAKALTLNAPAKINLSLHIPGRRADGYHELEGLVAFADVGDELSIERLPASEDPNKQELRIVGPFAPALADDALDDNLVLKAARLFVEATCSAERFNFQLTKNLPVASGIGGGSADAAAALNGLQRLARAPLEQDQLQALALRLGADVPMCLRSGAQYVQGVGEQALPVDLAQGLPALLVNPLVGVSTGAVFRQLGAGPLSPDFAPQKPQLPADTTPKGLIDWLKARRNDLQRPATDIAPVIGEVLASLQALPGCRLARMSGSGATCFALFDEEAAMAKAERLLKESHNGWWIVAARLR